MAGSAARFGFQVRAFLDAACLMSQAHRDRSLVRCRKLHRFPVSYPSYTDPSSSIAQAYQASTYFPQTLFFSRDGHAHYVFDHAGPYESATALEKDIRSYVLK